MTIRMSLWFACFAFWGGLTVARAADDPVSPDGDMLCGAKCLYTGLVALELDPGEYPEFLEKCGSVQPQGFSIGQLAEVAEKYGAQTLAVQTTLENLKLREERFVCIAHVDGNHFVNVGDVNDSSVWVVNPPVESSVARELFTNRWEGYALLLSKSELVREEDLRQPWGWKWMLGAVGIAAGIVVWFVVRKRGDS